ncbi:hypothetical protein B0H63DRAFT_461853 [Podospora didyma]|uniref:Uncharacterized protein n=1 Tax=Podospora didyma TaxID=330526 RepID=A0AAE0P7G1_9PEZI|nr:hypothetical protein B0H63DRAFT_461853 [Podospora didyma]
MASTTRLLSLPLRRIPTTTTTRTAATRSSTLITCCRQAIHNHAAQPAKVVPVYGTGPPPEVPKPTDEFAAEAAGSKIVRRRRQAEMLRQAKDIRAATAAGVRKSSESGVKKRFWKDVYVREVDGMFEIHLDARPLRRPTQGKEIIRLPLSKPHLAHALAIEWDQLVSIQEGGRHHLIPLTSTICRALDIADEDAAGVTTTRDNIASMLLRYLDTDSLLCFAPPPDENDHLSNTHITNAEGKTLYALQEEAYKDVVAFLTARAWPGVSIVPVLDGASIIPRQQTAGTREVVQGWALGLSCWELAGLERATLAGKSLLMAARLVIEWSEEGAGAVVQDDQKSSERGTWGVEEAAKAVSLEVSWQTRRWGEVEDTHDVEKEDLRRQLGSVVLLVSGTGSAASSVKETAKL